MHPLGMKILHPTPAQLEDFLIKRKKEKERPQTTKPEHKTREVTTQLSRLFLNRFSTEGPLSPGAQSSSVFDVNHLNEKLKSKQQTTVIAQRLSQNLMERLPQPSALRESRDSRLKNVPSRPQILE